MNNIKREFLFHDTNKLIPIQLLKTNYGMSNVSQTSILTESIESRDIEIILPNDDSSVVMLIDSSTAKILDIKPCQIGESSVTLTIYGNKVYWIYITSKNYVDGWIGTDYIIRDNGSQFEFRVEDSPQQVNLTETNNGTPRIRKAVDELNREQWFNYDGSYQRSDLIWDSPIEIGSNLEVYNYWLVMKSNILSSIRNMFKQRDLPNFANIDASTIGGKKNSLKMFAILSDIAEYMNDNKQNITETLSGTGIERLDPIWQFLNSSLPGNDGGDDWHTRYNLNLHNIIDEMGMYNDFIDSEYFNSYISNANEQALRDQGIFIAGTNSGAIGGVGVTQINMNKGEFEYGIQGREFISSTWRGILYRADQSNIPTTIWEEYEERARKLHSVKGQRILEFDQILNDYQLLGKATNRTQQTQWWSAYVSRAFILYENITEWLTESEEEMKREMAAAGYSMFISGSTTTGETETSGFQVAHEATLQNIRFLKNKLNEMSDSLWTSMNATNSLIISSLIDLSNSVSKNIETSPVINLTFSNVPNSNIEILWKKIEIGKNNSWMPLTSNEIVDLENGTKVINIGSLGLSTENSCGKYIFVVRPIKRTVNISSTISNQNGETLLMIVDELNDGKQDNYYYGYNAQIKSVDDGSNIGDQKIIAASTWNSSTQYLKLSPYIASMDQNISGQKLDIWSNEFIPVIIEVDIVQHNALTLSYSMYAKKEFTLDTGQCVIYDYAGNPYKTLSFGKISNEATGGSIVEYRVPAETKWTKAY